MEKGREEGEMSGEVPWGVVGRKKGEGRRVLRLEI